MRISIIGPTYPYRGGISHYTTLLSQELSKRHEVDLISFKRLFPKILYPGKFQKDYKSKIKTKCVYILDSINPLTWFQVFLRIKRTKSDLLIFNWWTPFFWIPFTLIAYFVKKVTDTKILSLCHNVVPHEKKGFLDKLFTKTFFNNCHYFLVHSKEEKENLISLMKNPKVLVSPHPTYNVFGENLLSKKETKDKLNIKDERVILFFGLIRQNKGLEYLIKAMPLVLKEIDVKLLIVGEFFGESKGKYLDEIKTLGIKENIKIIEGYVPDEEVGLYFSASDAVILPYISGTGSGILQIAFGLNKPVICTNVSFSDDIIDNETGLIVRKGDVENLAKAIIRFYKEKKEAVFIKNIKKNEDRFSWDKIVRVLEEGIPQNFNQRRGME